ncbi:MAG TPA: class III extradiol ring-cleavage dioxygenase, partial [Dyella sp.]|nr:class III extradiol ring-cleavage dioxygenase [Dyella sp.]
MSALPSLYVSHGSPMTALQPGATGARLAELAAALPRPRAIVVASAHYLARSPRVGGAAQPETVHDFGGFPAALYQMRYPAPGDPALASQIARLLGDAGLP